MDGRQKTGFQSFKETKAATPVGILIVLAVSTLLVTAGFVDMLGGLCIGVLSFYILRMFGIRKIHYLMLCAMLMFIIFTTILYLLKPDDISLANHISTVFTVLVLPFILISLIVWWMRRNLERMRERLEKEGRLYPQGYGRCKRCGTMVLPGETCCRRCGEYIDVPEEMRVKKANYFECSECSREVPEDAGVCPYCGEAFEGDVEVHLLKENSDDPKKDAEK
ncbi:MAG: hypothetical protein FWD92_01570 [Methanomassiliicoccaceae archaeon]|nr:hypothetical protein [Methanomassiliicoccaceae archaeon]